MPARLYLVFFAISSLLFIAGCTRPVSQFFHGWHVENAAVLKNVEGTWETYDVSIRFTSVKSQDLISFSGDVVLTPNYQLLYDQLRFFNVYLFFVDDSQAVLKTVALLSSVNDSAETVMRFDVSSEVPEGTASMALGYSGSVYERDNYSSFEMLPRQLPQSL